MKINYGYKLINNNSAWYAWKAEYAPVDDRAQQAGAAAPDELSSDAQRVKRYLQSCATAAGDNIAGHLATIDALLKLAAQQATAIPGAVASVKTWQERSEGSKDINHIVDAMESEIADLRAQLDNTHDALDGANTVLERVAAERDQLARQGQGEPVAEVLLADGVKVIDASMSFFDSVPVGTKLYLAVPTAPASAPEPVPMILHCPKCGLQHIDEPDERTPDWTNPPHRSHLCHGCGYIWRPADVPTVGVAAIETRGTADSAAPASAQPAESLIANESSVATARADAVLFKDEATRLRRVVRALGMEREVPEDDNTLRGALFAVLGQIARKLEAGARAADEGVMLKRNDGSPSGVVFAQPDQRESTAPANKVDAALKWLNTAQHGDNCFVSDHYEGDPGNRCNCGKDSLVEYLESDAAPQVPAVRAVVLEKCAHPMLEAAMKAAVSSGLIAKYADEAAYLRNWDGMKACVNAALAAAPSPDTATGADRVVVQPVAKTGEQSGAGKFCDSNCVWTDHHPDCQIGQGQDSAKAGAEGDRA